MGTWFGYRQQKSIDSSISDLESSDNGNEKLHESGFEGLPDLDLKEKIAGKKSIVDKLRPSLRKKIISIRGRASTSVLLSQPLRHPIEVSRCVMMRHLLLMWAPGDCLVRNILFE